MGAHCTMAAPLHGDAPMQLGEVAVHGGTLPVAVAGVGAPLILLHGWTLDHRMWQPQVAGLAGAFRLIMPDRRGCGRATAPPDLAREADDVLAIAEALGLDRFALLGLSRGAVVALDFARAYGARLTGLVVSGAPLPGLVAREEVIDLDRYRQWAAAGEMAALRADWKQHPLMRTCSPDAEALLAAMLADYTGRDLMVPATAPDLPHAALAALPMPLLAMTGAHDTAWRQACAAALAAAAPHARHALVPDAGHIANADNPAQFNALVSTFLRGCADPTQKA